MCTDGAKAMPLLLHRNHGRYVKIEGFLWRNRGTRFQKRFEEGQRVCSWKECPAIVRHCYSMIQIANPFASRSSRSVMPPPNIRVILDIPWRPITIVSSDSRFVENICGDIVLMTELQGHVGRVKPELRQHLTGLQQKRTFGFSFLP
jgi:hypothetical protein